MTEAAVKLKTPCTGGNVSFYNESPQSSIYPTPTVGIVGIIDDIEKRVPSFFQSENDVIYLIGETKNDLGGSQYLSIIHNLKKGPIADLNLNIEEQLQSFLIRASHEGLITSAHDVSDGGLTVALAECTFSPSCQIGAQIDISPLLKLQLRSDALLFGETHSRAIVTVKPENKKKFHNCINTYSLSFCEIGYCGGNKLVIGDYINADIDELNKIYEEAIPRRVSF